MDFGFAHLFGLFANYKVIRGLERRREYAGLHVSDQLEVVAVGNAKAVVYEQALVRPVESAVEVTIGAVEHFILAGVVALEWELIIIVFYRSEERRVGKEC